MGSGKPVVGNHIEADVGQAWSKNTLKKHALPHVISLIVLHDLCDLGLIFVRPSPSPPSSSQLPSKMMNSVIEYVDSIYDDVQSPTEGSS